ncbi:cag pathogenicity island protein Cag25 [Pseudoalteromonas sp. KS88]|uniref:EF-hand domain-containing protein n=1 Tax=Pseudoalteromonas sp. KS88 TaxID=2109918 RepID=UPI001080136B|nr:EF-hand domain-containing protein [Pseudoalteromonas sp. KS88]TGE85370.1 cag pathogenicity island protein Cag25 [Pseudoalteromonas sp. KS88]
MSTRVITLFCLSVILSFSATALDSKAIFAELDKDGNGMLSEGEAYEDAMLYKNFEQIDKDHSGQISYAEFKLFIQ